MKIAKGDEVEHWYQYIKTAVIFNAWDSSCEAMNGCDFDGDTAMCTDNPIIVNNTRELPTIICLQKKAEKKIPDEEDIIAANKLAFNDDIGTITNRVTSMFEIQSKFDTDSPEYRELEYRIMCGQNVQQNSIDRAKGIVSKPMPSEWYDFRANKITDEDSQDEIKTKDFYQTIIAEKKPYFMTYVYPRLKSENNTYVKNSNRGTARKFTQYNIKNIKQLEEYKNKTPDMITYLDYYYKKSPVGNNPCTVNRISWIFEEAFKKNRYSFNKEYFDYSILKCGTEYSREDYKKIFSLYKEYIKEVEKFCINNWNSKLNSEDFYNNKTLLKMLFQEKCEKICPNEDELCDIVLDICYNSEKSKEFAWEMCGEKIVNNLLKLNKNIISYPQMVSEKGDFTYCGNHFVMCEKEVGNE